MSSPPPAPPSQRRVLSGWGQRPASAADVILCARPADIDLAATGERGALARGLGRSYGDAATNAGGRVYDMAGVAGIRRLDTVAGTVTAAAGTSIDALLRALVPLGWFAPVVPGTRHVSLGGALAADIHGKNHHRDGSFACHVRRVTLITPAEGSLEVAPDDEVFAATAGGMGLTGVVTEVTLDLLPIATSRMRVDTERTADLDDALERMTAGDDRYRYSVAWIDLLARGSHTGRSVLTRGDHAEPGELDPRARRAALDYAPSSGPTVPPVLPSGLVNRATVRAFNEVWYRKSPRCEHGRITSIPAYFHPLDGVTDWNRIYGPRGFVQYQFVVPFGAEDTLRDIVDRLAVAQYPSFLAVLKRLGAGDERSGPLSFPLPGWTLAVDLPVGSDGLAELLAGFDEQVATAGGRVYLAKDARMSPEVFRAMYPRLDRFEAVRDRLDPQRVLQSDLARRLGL